MFGALKKKSSLFDINQSLVILAFDEMSIKSNLTYNSRVDKVIWYEDFGDIRTNNISTYVTVFMIKSLLGNWKQPVGYFLLLGL